MLPGALGANAVQESHTPHGLAVGPCAQFNDRARMRADDVFPQPRGPENRYAWLIRPASRATDSGSVTCSCPTTSANAAGRYLRYRATPAGYRRPVTRQTPVGPCMCVFAADGRRSNQLATAPAPEQTLDHDEATVDVLESMRRLPSALQQTGQRGPKP